MRSRTVNLNPNSVGRALDSTQTEVARVLRIVHLKRAPTAIGSLKWALDDQRRAGRIARVLACLEQGLVVIAGDRSGYVVRVKLHSLHLAL
jgi:hypothetical protein